LQKLRSLAGSVFVGDALRTHLDLRANLVDYLSQQDFRATPDPPALLDDRAASQKALAEAACAMHFFGGASDAALEAVEDSIEYCQGPTVLFQPFRAKLSAAEEFLLTNLPHDRYPQRVGPNESEVKDYLKNILTRTRKATAGAPPALGLICQPADFSWASKFQADQLSVDYPRFLLEKLTAMDRIRRWRTMVRSSHGLIFYQGESEESELERVRKLAEESGSRALQRWYLSSPNLDAKRAKRPADPAYDDGLKEFLNEVRRRAGGGS
jgi:hypothetical protein